MKIHCSEDLKFPPNPSYVKSPQCSGESSQQLGYLLRERILQLLHDHAAQVTHHVF